MTDSFYSWDPEQVRAIVEKHSYDYVGGVLVDVVSANMLITVYDALSPENQRRFRNMTITWAARIGWQLVK